MYKKNWHSFNKQAAVTLYLFFYFLLCVFPSFFVYYLVKMKTNWLLSSSFIFRFVYLIHWQTISVLSNCLLFCEEKYKYSMGLFGCVYVSFSRYCGCRQPDLLSWKIYCLTDSKQCMRFQSRVLHNNATHRKIEYRSRQFSLQRKEIKKKPKCKKYRSY